MSKGLSERKEYALGTRAPRGSNDTSCAASTKEKLTDSKAETQGNERKVCLEADHTSDGARGHRGIHPSLWTRFFSLPEAHYTQEVMKQRTKGIGSITATYFDHGRCTVAESEYRRGRVGKEDESGNECTRWASRRIHPMIRASQTRPT